MALRLGLVLVLAVVQVTVGDLRREWVPQSMTAAEMWNPWTWYYPYGIAAAEAWADYLKNAQQASNQLYQQWHATGAQWGWWSGGQSQYVPGSGANNTAQAAGSQVPGVNSKNESSAGRNETSTTEKPAEQDEGGSQTATDSTQPPAGQYVPSRQRRFAP